MQPNKLVRTPSDEQALSEGMTFRPECGQRVIDWIETNCVLSQDPYVGQLIKLLDWQKDLLLQLYGWRRADGTRRFRKAALWVPKKNGKSGLLSALGAYHLTQAAGQQVFLVAAKREQAAIIYNETASIIAYHPELRDLYKPHYQPKTIDCRANRSELKVLSSERRGQSGINASIIIADEIADWDKSGREVWQQLINAGIARTEPLLFTLSHPQFDRSTFAFEEYTLAKKVLSGEVILTDFLPVVYECREDHWEDPEEWQRANPSWGVLIRPETFHEAYKRAKANPVEESVFKCHRCGIWASDFNAWIAASDWEKCKQDFKEEDLYGSIADVGWDHATIGGDLAAYVLWVVKDGKYYMLPRVYTPADTLEQKEKADGVSYRYWAERGWLRTCEGNCINPADIRQGIKEDAKHFNIREIRYDPSFAYETALILQDEGFEVSPVQTGFATMSAPTRFFEKLVKEGRLVHNGNPVATWSISNCVLRSNESDQVMPAKKKSKARTDVVMAALYGLTSVMAYETQEEWPCDQAFCFTL